MSQTPLRHIVAVDAARLLYSREYKEYFHAKREAARRNHCKILPTNQEIHSQIIHIAESLEGEQRPLRLRDMRTVALKVMTLLHDFRPRLVGSVLTGHIRKGSDIDLHLYCDHLEGVTKCLTQANFPFEVLRVESHGAGGAKEFTHIRMTYPPDYEIEMTLYSVDQHNEHPTCSISGGPMPRADLCEVEQLLYESSDAIRSPVSNQGLLRLKDLLSSPISLDTVVGVIPELEACRGILEDNFSRRDVFESTCEVVAQLESAHEDNFSFLGPVCSDLSQWLESPGGGGLSRWELLCLAAICQDLGKPSTASVHRSGRMQHVGHESVGAQMAVAIAERLKLAQPDIAKLEKLVGQHSRAIHLTAKRPRASDLYKFFRCASDCAPELLILSWANVVSVGRPSSRRISDQIAFVREMLEEFFAKGFLLFPSNPVSITDLEMEFGLVRDKLLQTLMEKLNEDYVDGQFKGREDGLVWAAELLETAPELW